MKQRELKPVVDPTSDFEKIEGRIKAKFRELLYLPLLRTLALPRSVVQNDNDALLDALRRGRITFERGVFRGTFNASITKELRRLGAVWDRKTSSYRLATSDVPSDVRQTAEASQALFEKRLKAVGEKLAQILPEDIADSIKTADLFDSSIFKTDREIGKTLKAITVQPRLTPDQRFKIASEWAQNMDLWIETFAKEEILKLRKTMEARTFGGDRYEGAVSAIKRSYGVTASKAKFLARQETHLLLAKLKETRYTDAGVLEYKWRCVTGTKNHPVRPAHKALDGTTQRWDAPPITSPDGRRNNPGQDYNCRCHAIPIVKFHSEASG